MEFDKSKVYTALNADELKIGSKVIVANSIGVLKERITAYYNGDTQYVAIIKNIETEKYDGRFEISISNSVYACTLWLLAYLVSEPNAIRCADLNIGDVVTDGISEFMVLGVDRANDEIFLPRLEWVSDADLTGYHKKED